jgi:hypothetical protein
MVSAREKLNHATVAGAVLVATFVGALSGSWTAFWVAAGVLLACALCSGHIRLSPIRR